MDMMFSVSKVIGSTEKHFTHVFFIFACTAAKFTAPPSDILGKWMIWLDEAIGSARGTLEGCGNGDATSNF
jgi:hypothetical protein